MVFLFRQKPGMTSIQKFRCIEDIYQKIKEMMDFEFPAFGSLYFVDSPVDSADRVLLDDKFCIGPHCRSSYWDCDVSDPRYYHEVGSNRGPCRYHAILISQIQKLD